MTRLLKALLEASAEIPQPTTREFDPAGHLEQRERIGICVVCGRPTSWHFNTRTNEFISCAREAR